MIGEAPGEEEDKQRIPFVGRAGQLLNEVLNEAGINREQNWVTNVINCRPSNNNFNSHETKVARKRHCNEGIWEELSWLYSVRYRYCVVLENNAGEVFDFSKVTKNRGKVIELNGFKLIFTFHPSYVTRNGGKGSELWNTWISDLSH